MVSLPIIATFSLSIFFTQCHVSPPIINGRPMEGLVAFEPDYDGPSTEPQYINYSSIVQRVDHFTAGDSRTWRQRYLYNSKFYNKTTGYVFLMLNGDSNINVVDGDKWVIHEGMPMMKWAAEFGAGAFQLEHRFYGEKDFSPFGDQTIESLRYLTIEQALADAKEFITQMNSLYFEDENPVWITFGASYSGSLSAWFRETYPEMIAGAVTSSSAVNVLVDNYGFAINIEKTFRNVSDSCANVIGTAFQNMISKAYNGSDSRAWLKQKFNLCDDFDESRITRSVQFFFQFISGYFGRINLYTGTNRNNATRNGYSVPKACEILNNATIGDEIDRVVAMLDFADSFSTLSCRDNNYTQFIQRYGNTTMSNVQVANVRSWIWQTCTELGYYQTTDGGNNGIFGSTVPLDYYADMCIDLFGPESTLTKTFDGVAKLQSKYGGSQNYKGTKVCFPNGSNDPWHSLGYNSTATQSQGVDSWLIEGTAHCADIYPERDSDLQSLKNARIRIHDNLKQWLTDARETSNFGSKNSFLLSILIAISSSIFI